ncbi:galactokinase [Kineosphaera limosa]|uniref:Galactokinase n=1 Tax=Kineosphaera limosa NBRC 100340 TaxID=1184609 RepID=K6VE86_9MICO|nr:galactokinase [Kineosphaera limosa]NYE03186.1 galactokinase [Kineosphaera limosa]GAB94523.1 galactokinase [Kineosphaera limosa NBRC 100340]
MSEQEHAAQLFEELHGRAPAGVWAAPGRVNLIGEHTDYNEGFVLPLAIRQRCVVAAAPATGAQSSVTSAQRPGETIRFTAADLTPGAVEGWAAYVAGVLWALREAGHDVGDVDLVVDSTVPLGASLSSSAAIECAVASAAAGLAGIDLDATQIALLAQRAENDYVGMPCGVMDQMASMHGKPGQLVFIDTRTLDVRNVPFDLSGSGLALLVIDTRAPHALVDGEYAARRRDCEEAARQLGVTALRDISGDELDDALAKLSDDTLRKRARHVVTEDDRVLTVVDILGSGADPREIGPLLTASHASMRDDFEITVPHVDVAVDAALAAGAVGARMTGGGFGGSIIALVAAQGPAGAEAVADAVRQAYSERGWTSPAPFVTQAEQGATRLT